MPENNAIEAQGYAFSLRMVDLYQKLSKKKHYAIALQLLGSGTKIGVKIVEAQQAQSEKGFQEKVEQSVKEAIETQYWLKLIHDSGLVKYEYESYYEDVENLIEMLKGLDFSRQ